MLTIYHFDSISKKDFILYSEAVLGILTYTVQKIPCHSSNFFNFLYLN